MLDRGNIYTLSNKGKKEYSRLDKILYIKILDDEYSLILNVHVHNNTQIQSMIGHFVFENNSEKVFVDCRAFHKIKSKYIKKDNTIIINNKQNVISNIYDFYNTVKEEKAAIIESIKKIKQQIEFSKINNKDYKELSKKYNNNQEKVLNNLCISPYGKPPCEKVTFYNKEKSNSYYSMFRETPSSSYIKFYRG